MRDVWDRIFPRIPDGYHKGKGSKRYNNQSIFKLHNNEISQITDIENKNIFTKKEILDTLKKSLQEFSNGEPLSIWTINSTVSLEQSHSDHYIASIWSDHIGKDIDNCASSYIFEDYRMQQYGVNLSLSNQDKKKYLFYAYNNQVKEDGFEDLESDLRYQSWLMRTYIKKTSCNEIIPY